VDRALQILRSEYVRTMQLMGVVRTDDLGAEHVSLRGR
jgi:L-lactate dehydrogenase (cytochrome)